MADYFNARGGEVRVNSRLQRIDLNSDGTVQSFRLADGSAIQGDLYISAMPGATVQPSSCWIVLQLGHKRLMLVQEMCRDYIMPCTI